jgi:hypothetical protein
VGDPERDFFLPRFESAPASASDMAILINIIIQELRMPILASPSGRGEDPACWREGPYCLVKTPMCNGWTGHNERCTMPSLLASMSVPKAERDPLGTWSPSGSDDYVRTYRVLIRDLMSRFRRAVSAGEAASFADEEEAIDDARAFAGKFEAYTNEELMGAAGRLSEAAAALFSGLAGRAVPGASQRDEGGSVIQPIPPHDDWGIVTTAQEGWDDFAANLRARSQAAQPLPGRPLDPRIVRELLPDQVGQRPRVRSTSRLSLT